MRLRLILSFALVVLVAVAAMTIAMRFSAASEVQRFMFGGEMAGLNEIAAELQAFWEQNQSWAGVESLLARQGAGRMQRGQGMGMMAGQRLLLADEQGVVIANTAGFQTGAQLSAAEQQEAVPIRSGLRTVGYLLAEGGMGFVQGDQARLVSRLGNAALLAGLAGGAAALLLALLLSYGLLRPVSALTAAAARLAGGDLAQRVPVKGSDELAGLGRAFNDMAGALQQAERGRQALTADIAHELRTPLAIQRAHLEALQDGIYPLAVENLAPILEQNILLARLVDDLRTLALAESGGLQLERTSTDLAVLAQRSLERFTPQAAARAIHLEFERSSAPLPPVSVDPGRIEQILNNLLSNALRHTPDGGHIRLEVRDQPQAAPPAVLLTVQDSGPGISPEALPHVFERFYRADRSRSRSEGGAGLGLAIARQLAEAHGGTLTASNNPQGGAIFTLLLPIEPGRPRRPEGTKAR